MQSLSVADGGPASATPSVPPSNAIEQQGSSKVEGLRLVKNGAAKLPREVLVDELQERANQGLCLVCQLKATHSSPTVSVVPMAFSSIARWLGAVPVERVIVTPNPKSFPVFCGHHHAIALKLLEEQLANAQLDHAEFARKKKEQWMVYTRFGMIEDMRGRERDILSDGQKKRKKQAPAALPSQSTGS